MHIKYRTVIALAELIGFDGFVRSLFGALNVDLPYEEVSSETTLLTDLAIDSLSLFEILVVLEDFGVRITDDEIVRVGSIGDLYRLYAVKAAAPPD